MLKIKDRQAENRGIWHKITNNFETDYSHFLAYLNASRILKTE